MSKNEFRILEFGEILYIIIEIIKNANYKKIPKVVTRIIRKAETKEKENIIKNLKDIRSFFNIKEQYDIYIEELKGDILLNSLTLNDNYWIRLMVYLKIPSICKVNFKEEIKLLKKEDIPILNGICHKLEILTEKELFNIL